MTPMVSISLQIPSAVWDAYRHAAQHEAVTAESIARQVLCDACDAMARAHADELAEVEKVARSVG